MATTQSLVDYLEDYEKRKVLSGIIPTPVVNELIGKLRILTLAELVIENPGEAWHRLGVRETP